MWYVPGVSRWFNWFKYVAMFNLILVGGFNPPEKYESNSKSSPIFAGWTFQQNMHLKPLTLSDFSRFTALGFLGHPSVETLHRLPPRWNASPAEVRSCHHTEARARATEPKSLHLQFSHFGCCATWRIFGFEHVGNCWDFCWFFIFFCVRWPFCWDDSPVEGCWWFRNYGMKKSRWITWLALFVVFFGISQHRW